MTGDGTCQDGLVAPQEVIRPHPPRPWSVAVDVLWPVNHEQKGRVSAKPGFRPRDWQHGRSPAPQEPQGP